ncbi:hypothetical protein GCM10027589_49660 [Actinocorallia lasiicapitis]
MPTLRETIEMLTALADQSPDGLDTPVEFGICDATDLQMIDEIDLGIYQRISVRTSEVGTYVMFRGHHHPGAVPGALLRGAAADVDDELRDLTGEL